METVGSLLCLTFRNRASYIYDGHTAKLHFIYLFNKYTYWIF